ncbi:hypothetical protein CLV90_2240 [Maribacter spongiicola]|uniref:Lipoprotein n=1 Tax=Maribacter spongiicola TaxID=1206753 RepID=A0A4R7K3S5_9FLAO|nr:hypothetical protein [Maribacter spongiicola]TDT45156.1 hypothetical protein CLV90_2240 [Maribacter spongiicola]
MKLKILVVFISLLILSCNSKPNRVENDLYNCMIDSLSKEEKAKTILIIREFEEHLIKEGILESSAPISYWKFYEKIAKTNTYEFNNNFNFFKKVEFLDRDDPSDIHGMIDCSNQIFLTEKYKESRLFEFTQEMESLRKHKVTPVIMAKTTIKFLKKEDFELDYYRFITLGFIEKYNNK